MIYYTRKTHSTYSIVASFASSSFTFSVSTAARETLIFWSDFGRTSPADPGSRSHLSQPSGAQPCSQSLQEVASNAWAGLRSLKKVVGNRSFS